MDDIKTCPLLGNDCLQGNCAWFCADRTCAMRSMAILLDAINYKLLRALDVMDGDAGASHA